jgi:hypothetical protein
VVEGGCGEKDTFFFFLPSGIVSYLSSRGIERRLIEGLRRTTPSFQSSDVCQATLPIPTGPATSSALAVARTRYALQASKTFTQATGRRIYCCEIARKRRKAEESLAEGRGDAIY